MSKELTLYKAVTIDEEIDILNSLVESGRVSHMVTVIALKNGYVSLCPCGAPVEAVQEILEAALGAVKEYRAGKAHMPRGG